ERRKVHCIPDHAAPQEVPNGGGRVRADELLRFFGCGCDMWSGDNLRQLSQRPVRWRLLLEDVEAGALDDAALEGAAERVFIDELAARRVDQPESGFAEGESRVVEQVAGFRRQRQVQRDVVGGRAERVEGQQLDAEPGGYLGRYVRIVRDDSHAKGPRALD